MTRKISERLSLINLSLPIKLFRTFGGVAFSADSRLTLTTGQTELLLNDDQSALTSTAKDSTSRREMGKKNYANAAGNDYIIRPLRKT